MKSKLLSTVIILSMFVCMTEALMACINLPDPSIDAIKEIEGQNEYTAYTYQGEVYVTVNKDVKFYCSAVDLDDDSMTYALDYNYNDGTDASGDVPPGGDFDETHTYSSTGTYIVRLTVTDVDGSSWVEYTVHVEPEKVYNETKDIWYSYIQVAIDRADNDDILTASEGTYLENIDFLGKDITLTSTNPYDSAVVKNTIIKGNGREATVTFSGDETDCIFTGFTVTSKSLDEGLVAHWKLDDASGTDADDEIGNYDGTLIDFPTDNSQWVNGHVDDGGALEFDGTEDYVDCGTWDIDDFGGTTGAVTIAAWVKLDSDNRYDCITRNIGGVYYFSAGTDTSNKLRVLARNLTIDDYQWVISEGTIASGVWTHVVFTLEAGEGCKFYINGVFDSEDTDSDLGLYNYGSNAYVGHGYDSTNGFFKGGLDDVRIYNRALDEIEIERLFAENPTLPESQWTFDDGTDETVDDSYGGITGTLEPDYAGNDCPSYFNKGGSDNALLFDGINDYVDLGNTLDDITIPFSVSAWINVDTYTSGVCIFKSHDTHSARYGFSLQLADLGQGNLLCLNYSDGTQWGRRTKGSIDENDVHITFPSDEWVFVTGVVRGPTDMDLYANGQNMGGIYSGSGGSMATTTGAIATIGSNMDSDDSTLYFEGMIDDVRVYDRALTSMEVRSIAGLSGFGGVNGNGTLATISNCIITGNESDFGGGIYGFDGIIEDCNVVDNIAYYGGGIADCQGTIRNSLVAQNLALEDGGAFYGCDEGTIINCTIVENAAITNGDGISDCDGTIKNCILWDNGSLYADQLYDSSLPTYSCIKGWTTEEGEGNKADDPDFVDPDGKDDDSSTVLDNNYHITSSSDCVDAGDNSLSMDYTGQKDIDGQIRVGNYRVDIGFDEYFVDTEETPYEDTDNDGLLDSWEIANGLTVGFDDSQYDADFDGLTNEYEYIHNLTANDEDSDEDGMADGWEIENLLDPWDDGTEDATKGPAGDPDGDELTNLQEFELGLDPQAVDSDVAWTEYSYDNSGNMMSQISYEATETLGVENTLSDTRYEYDDIDRRYLQRSVANPGTTNDTNDNIELTLYNIDGTVSKKIQKGIGKSDLGDTGDYDPYESGDIKVEYTYDNSGHLVTLEDPLGGETTYEYDDFGQQTLVTVPAGQTTDYEYDYAGRVTMTFFEDLSYVMVEYRMNRAIIQKSFDSSDTALSQQRMYYNNLGDLTKRAVLNTPSTATAYETYTPSTTTDRVAEYLTDYDSSSKEWYVYTYSGSMKITSKSSTDDTYDKSGHGLAAISVSGDTSTAGHPKVISYRYYDKAGRVTKSVRDSYDESPSVQLSLTSRMEYDDFGRLQYAIADGASDLTTEYKYDGMGRQVEVKDPKNYATTYDYDGMGRMVTKAEDTGSKNRRTISQYDRLGRLTDLTAYVDGGANDQTTSYEYDLAGKVTKITYPDSGEITYAYDDAGQVTKRIDQNAVTTKYVYDNMGRLVTKQNKLTSPDIVEVYAYDARGLVTKASKGTSTGTTDDISDCVMSYNVFGSLTQSTQEILEGNTKTVTYTRDQQGRAISLEYPDSGSVTLEYAYTSLGRIDTIDRDSTGIIEYDYYGTSVSDRDYTAANVGVSFDAIYDSFGRITTHKTLNDDDPQEGVDFTYTYDDNSNIVSKKFEHRTSDPSNVYTYDTLNRVTRSDFHDSDYEQFTYDVLGNRITARNRDTTTDTYTNNTVNEYTQIIVDSSTKTPVYDDAGNLTEDINGYTYEYDYENRITVIKDDSSNTVAEYVYDALGRRVQVKDAKADANDRFKRFYYDAQRVLLEATIDDDLDAESEADDRYYVYGNYIDEVLVMNDGTDDHYYGHDHLFSAVVLFDDTGDILERYEYDAYGKCTVLQPNFTPDGDNISDFGNPYLFTGRRLDILDDSSFKIQYSRARYYDSETGRFLQRDPLGISPGGGKENPFAIYKLYQDSMSLYEYVSSQSVSNVDPYGLNLEIRDPLGKLYRDYWHSKPNPGAICPPGKAGKVKKHTVKTKCGTKKIFCFFTINAYIRCKTKYKCTHSKGELYSNTFGLHSWENGASGGVFVYRWTKVKGTKKCGKCW